MEQRIIHIAGTPVAITGEGKEYNGWLVSPAQYIMKNGKLWTGFVAEKENRHTLCASESIAHTWIRRMTK